MLELDLSMGFVPPVGAASEKKADVVEHLEVFDRVGLLYDEPLGLDRGALQLVIQPS
jgi:hypothetical protein